VKKREIGRRLRISKDRLSVDETALLHRASRLSVDETALLHRASRLSVDETALFYRASRGLSCFASRLSVDGGLNVIKGVQGMYRSLSMNKTAG
jgi:Fe-S cluster assembly scaffold protein SufB